MSYTLVSLLFIVFFSLPSLGERINRSYIIQNNNCSYDSECPTWFTCNSSSMCQCGNKQDHAITCDDKVQRSAVLDCYCVTYDNESGSTYLGLCFYNCDNYKISTVYQPLPTNAEMLINGSVCTDFNRAGLLCGNCQNGYSPFVLSYNLSCVKCPNGNQNWWKFILAGFGPLTFFYFFVVVFSINVTSSHLHGVVWFSQALSIPALVRGIMLTGHRENPNLLNILRVLTLFYSIWNLDFFRTVIPDICLNVTTLQALALDYLVALYPFLLILFSHMIIKLYDSHVHCMTVMWRPFRILLAKVRESMDIRTSIIDSFATFFLLSYVKVLSVTSDLLVPTRIYKLGSNISTLGVYYSPTIVFFGEEHLPYAILALFILTIFVCVPIITLVLYPFQFFQKFLSLFPFHWHYLHAFVDSFQGCYKDGTEPGTCDYRWFSVLPLLLRLTIVIIFTSTLSMIFFVYAVITLTVVLLAIINVQPFKKSAVRYPSNDPIFFILLIFTSIISIAVDVTSRENLFFYYGTLIMLLFSVIVPIIYITFFITLWLARRVEWIHQLIDKQRCQS